MALKICLLQEKAEFRAFKRIYFVSMVNIGYILRDTKKLNELLVSLIAAKMALEEESGWKNNGQLS